MPTMKTLDAARRGSALPRLPRPAAATDPQALQRVRRFHLDPGQGDAEAAAGYLPALLHPFREAGRVRTDYPLFLGLAEADEGALCLSLPDLLSRLTPGEGEARILGDNLRRLEGHIRELTSGAAVPVEAREVLEKAAASMMAELKLGEADSTRLETDLGALVESVPAGGRLIPWSAEAPLHLMLAAIRDRQRPAREAFRAEARELAAALGALLEADRRKRPEGREAKALSAGMGQMGDRLVDPSALAGMLKERRGGSTLVPARRESLEQVLASLSGALEPVEAPLPLLVHGGEGGLVVPEGFRVERAKDPCAAAAAAFDREAGTLARLLRAVRVARLETAGKYDPERHDPWLDRLDWQAFSGEELRLLPTVVAVVSADQVARRGMLSLSRLLLSGRPVQVLMPVDPAASPGAEPGGDPLAEFRFEPAYLGISHREAWVQQTSMSRPEHLLRGLRRALEATRGGLHVVASMPASEQAPVPPELATASALEGRAHPIFHYDPEAGASWARRLDFAGNPAPQVDWPVAALSCQLPTGGEQSLELSFTFADFALLSPAYRRHFQPIPDGVPETELMPLASWLELPVTRDSHALPFIWGADASGEMRRLAVSRRLALACRDRLGFWRILQELSGVRSEYVREAEARLREDAEARVSALRQQLETEHATELDKVRRQAAEEVVERLTAALLEVDLAAFAAPAAVVPFGDGLAGKSVEEVSAALLAMVDPASLEAAAPGEPRIEEMAAQLLELVAPKAGEEM